MWSNTVPNSVGTSTSGSVTKTNRTVIVENTVTAQQAQSLTIRSVISEGGLTRTIYYEVPFVQVFRTIPGTVSLTKSGSSFTRNVRGLLPDGKAFEIMESGSTDGV